jgi:hypothetical protein
LRDAYETLGRTYTATRGEDPRIAAQLNAALGEARTVVDVGAGTGSYEPRDRWVLAVEPSPVMMARAGTWDARYGHLRKVETLDAGYRLVVAEL